MKDDKDNVQLGAVEDHDGILTIRGGGPRRDWNGIHYKQGMSAKNVGTTKLSANIATIPPGGVAAAHIHVGFEVMLYILAGRVRRVRTWTDVGGREPGRRLHFHRARRAARSLQSQRERAGRRRGGAVGCKRVGAHRSLHPPRRLV